MLAAENNTFPKAVTHRFEQGALVVARGPIGVVGGERLLGEDVQTGEQAQGFVEIEVVDVAAPFLVEEFERQQGQERAGGGDHLRAGIARLDDDPVEPQFGQERQEQEDPGVACLQPPSGFEAQEPLVRDGGFFGAVPVFTTRVGRVVALDRRGQKGGDAAPGETGRETD